MLIIFSHPCDHLAVENQYYTSGDIFDGRTGQLIFFAISANLNHSSLGDLARLAQNPVEFQQPPKSDGQAALAPAFIFELEDGSWLGDGAEMVADQEIYKAALVRAGRFLMPSTKVVKHGM